MALLFNLFLLESESQCEPKKLVKLLELHFYKKTVPKTYKSIKPIKNLSGTSYLLNAALLFTDKNTDITYKAQYIRLAGRRDYSQYKYYDIKYLDLSFFSDIDLDAIRHNPLLTIKENKIHFKYEEI